MYPKVTVTKPQQHSVNFEKKNKNKTLGNLFDIQAYNFDRLELHRKIIFKMTEQQIAFAYYGIAEIEPEPVEPWRALKAIYEGKTIKKVDYDGGITILNDYVELDNFSIFHPDAVESLGTKFYILEDE